MSGDDVSCCDWYSTYSDIGITFCLYSSINYSSDGDYH